MEEKKFVSFKKEELGVKEYIKRELGKGRISNVSIEYTPVGEKIIIATSKPGLVIGRRGEKIDELTRVLKKSFHLDNPNIEIKEIIDPILDAQLVSDEIALLLERKGSLKFKVIKPSKSISLICGLLKIIAALPFSSTSLFIAPKVSKTISFLLTSPIIYKS